MSSILTPGNWYRIPRLDAFSRGSLVYRLYYYVVNRHKVEVYKLDPEEGVHLTYLWEMKGMYLKMFTETWNNKELIKCLVLELHNEKSRTNNRSEWVSASLSAD